MATGKEKSVNVAQQGNPADALQSRLIFALASKKFNEQ